MTRERTDSSSEFNDEVPLPTFMDKLVALYRSQIPPKLRRIRTGMYSASLLVHAVLVVVFFYMIVATITECTITNYISLKKRSNPDTSCDDVPITVSDTFFLTDTGIWSSKSDFTYSDSMIQTKFKSYANSDQGFVEDMTGFNEVFKNFSEDLVDNFYTKNLLKLMGFRNGSAVDTMTTEVLLDYQYILEPELSDVYLSSADCSLFNPTQNIASMGSSETDSGRFTSTSSTYMDNNELTIKITINYIGSSEDFRFDDSRDCPNGFWGQVTSSGLLCSMSIDSNVLMLVAAINEGIADPEEELLPVQNANYSYLARKYESGTTIVKYLDGEFYILSRTNSLISVNFEHWASESCSDCSTRSGNECYSNDFDLVIVPEDISYADAKDNGENNISTIFDVIELSERTQCGLYSQFMSYPANSNEQSDCPFTEKVCIASFIGDGWCDPENNNACCDYDGGDCCPDTCVDSLYDCGVNGYSCCESVESCATTCAAGLNCNEWDTGDGVSYSSSLTYDDDGTPNSRRRMEADLYEVPIPREHVRSVSQSNEKQLEDAIRELKRKVEPAAIGYEQYLAEQKRKEHRDETAMRQAFDRKEKSSEFHLKLKRRTLEEEVEDTKAFHENLRQVHMSKSDRQAKSKEFKARFNAYYDGSDEAVEEYLANRGDMMSHMKARKMLRTHDLSMKVASRKQQRMEKARRTTTLRDLLGENSFSQLPEEAQKEVLQVYNDLQREEYHQEQRKLAKRKFDRNMKTAAKMVITGEYHTATRIVEEHRVRHDEEHKRKLLNRMDRKKDVHKSIHDLLEIPDGHVNKHSSLWESEDHFLNSIQEQHRHLTISTPNFANETIMISKTFAADDMRLVGRPSDTSVVNVTGYLEFKVNTSVCGFQSNLTNSCYDYYYPLNPCSADPSRTLGCTSVDAEERWLPVCTEGMEEEVKDGICGGYCQTMHGTNFTGFGTTNADLTAFLDDNSTNISETEYYQYVVNSGGVRPYLGAAGLDALDKFYEEDNRTAFLNVQALNVIPPDGDNSGPPCSNLACFCHYNRPRDQSEWSFRIQSDTRFLNSLFYQLPERKMQCLNPFNSIVQTTSAPTALVESFYDCTTETCPTFFQALGVAFANASSFHDIVLAIVVSYLVFYIRTVKDEDFKLRDSGEIDLILYQLADKEIERRTERTGHQSIDDYPLENLEEHMDGDEEEDPLTFSKNKISTEGTEGEIEREVALVSVTKTL